MQASAMGKTGDRGDLSHGSGTESGIKPAEPSDAPFTVSVGDRVSCDGSLGTARYVGSVDGSKGVWMGIEWDDPDRGRHDGSMKGKRYFSVAHSTGASFLRLSKLSRPVSCTESVVDRYGVIEDASGVVDRIQLGDLQRGLNARFVRIIGLSKINKQQSMYVNLRDVFLRGCCIVGDDPPLLGQLCPNIYDLDLSENLLTSWASVAQIVQQLARLKLLNLSRNHLSGRDSNLRSAFSGLEAMFLNRQGYEWSDVLECAEMWPNVVALTLLSNRITRLSVPPSTVFQQLDFLDLEDNPINDWKLVLHLSSLPSLRELSLIHTGLQYIEIEDTPDSPIFPSLESMLLCNNNISDWSSIGALNRLPKLKKLKFSGNPLHATESSESIRSQVIAKVGGLTVLNKSEIPREERRWAELDYLRQFGADWRAAGGRLVPGKRPPEEWRKFELLHPRFTHLCQTWGEPEDSELKVTSSTIQSNLVSVVVRRADRSDTKTFSRSLPLAMRISKLRVLVNKLYQGELSRLSLSYSIPDRPDWEVEMHQDKDINFFGLEDGYCVIARYSD